MLCVIILFCFSLAPCRGGLCTAANDKRNTKLTRLRGITRVIIILRYTIIVYLFYHRWKENTKKLHDTCTSNVLYRVGWWVNQMFSNDNFLFFYSLTRDVLINFCSQFSLAIFVCSRLLYHNVTIIHMYVTSYAIGLQNFNVIIVSLGLDYCILNVIIKFNSSILILLHL